MQDADSTGAAGGDADPRARRQLAPLIGIGFILTLAVVALLLLAALQATARIDAVSAAREELQVTRAMAAMPGGMNTITVGVLADRLDLSGARLTTRAALAPGETAVPVAPGTDSVLAWRPHRLGLRSFEQLAPLRAAAALLFLLLAGLVGWRLSAAGRRLGPRHARGRRLAATDALTGLANRFAFDAGLAERCARLRAGGAGFALVTFDLDGFRAMNNGFGRAAGDAALQFVGRHLAEMAGPSDLAARIGGDEFAVLRSAFGLDAYLDEIKARLDVPLDITGRLLGVAASIGVARAVDFPEPAELLRAADSALHRARRSGPGNAELALPRQREAA